MILISAPKITDLAGLRSALQDAIRLELFYHSAVSDRALHADGFVGGGAICANDHQKYR